MLNYIYFNLYRTPNDQSSSNTQISIPLMLPVENVTHTTNNSISMSPVTKRVKVTFPIVQDNSDLAFDYRFTTNKNITDSVHSNTDTHKLEISISSIKNNFAHHNIVRRRILYLV